MNAKTDGLGIPPSKEYPYWDYTEFKRWKEQYVRYGRGYESRKGIGQVHKYPDGEFSDEKIQRSLDKWGYAHAPRGTAIKAGELKRSGVMFDTYVKKK